MPGKGLEDAHQECVVEGARGTFPSAEKFPLAPSNTPTPLKNARFRSRPVQSSPPSAKPYPQERRPSGHQAALWNKGRDTRERTAPAQESGSSERQQQGQNHRPCTRSPLPQAARSVMPCLVDQWFEDAGAAVRGRENRGRAGRHSLHLSESAVSIPQDGNRNGSTLPCGRPLLFSPDFVPRTQKGPLAGALVSFSLIRPEPDTVIGTTRRFQPWRELPSWLRAGGSVR